VRKSFPAATLLHLRQTPSDAALRSLTLFCKVDATYHPVKDPNSRHWHVRTDHGEFEILTTGVKWYDARAKMGGGGAIDLAMHILHVPFAEAARILTARTEPRG